MSTFWWEDNEQIEKLASSGVSPEFLEAIIKEAAHQKDRQEVYDDFDAAGRIMAHGYWDELCKKAAANLPEQYSAPESSDEKLAALKKLFKRG